MKLIIYTDGGARGNPGPAAIGVVICHENKKIIKKYSKYIGEATNNQAEYRAVIDALKEAKKVGAQEIDFYLDSELLVGQLSRRFKIKNTELGQVFVKIWNLSQAFKKINFFYIPREKNKEADRLVNLALKKINL
ncbi:MAG: ribonuclease HI family protein [Patescibacteria group bacterium]|nr:ribonuclease HI family protein [Patescibacteria group bacterium]